MKYLITALIIFMFPLVGISQEMECRKVGNYFKRCENKEVICYVYIQQLLESTQVQCKFKKPIKKQTTVNVIP